MSDDSKVIIEDNKINFSCLVDDCPNSCCGPFAGFNNELESVDKRPFSEIILTDDDVDILFDQGYADLIEENIGANGKHYYRMKLLPDGTCTALKNGRCSIHKINPTLCRAFPFYIDMFVGLCAIKCPGFGEDWTSSEELQVYFDATKDMYNYWLQFYGIKRKD